VTRRVVLPLICAFFCAFFLGVLCGAFISPRHVSVTIENATGLEFEIWVDNVGDNYTVHIGDPERMARNDL
jgi:hypothetical protein